VLRVLCGPVRLLIRYEPGATELQNGSGWNAPFFDHDYSYEGAIATAQVSQNDSDLFQSNLAMNARNGRILDFQERCHGRFRCVQVATRLRAYRGLAPLRL
jgi:hypothetical protein